MSYYDDKMLKLRSFEMSDDNMKPEKKTAKKRAAVRQPKQKVATAPMRASESEQPSSKSKQLPPLTDEEADRIVHSYKPAGLLSEEEKLERIRTVKRLVEFNRGRMDAETPTLPAEYKDVDRAALCWVAARCVDWHFRCRFQDVISNLIKSGHLFESGQFQLVNTIIEQLRNLAAKPEQEAVLPEALNELLDPCRKAQDELASITAKFIIAKSINKSFAMPWVLEEAQRKHFRTKWAYIRRQEKPHDRVQLQFIFEAMVKFDAVMKTLFNGPLKWQKEQFPQPRSDAADFMTRLERLSAILASVVNEILDAIEAMQVESTYALGLQWSGGWTELRLRQQERVLGILEPYLKAEWAAFKRARPELLKKPHTLSAIGGRPWKIAWPSLSNCLRTTLREFCYPPIDPSHGNWFIPRHTPVD